MAPNLESINSSQPLVSVPHLSYLSRMKFLLLFLLMQSMNAICADKYPDFATLACHEKENEDFKIRVEDVQSDVTILAVHGGGIEPGTSELTQAIHGKFNRYYFEGIKKDNNFSLHLTSARFDEPRALDLVARSKNCLALHGFRGVGKKSFCVGGRNKALAEKIIGKLQNLNYDFEIQFPCKAYPGQDLKNIVNRCQNAGVQLEMNDELRDQLLSNPGMMKDVAQALSESLI